MTSVPTHPEPTEAPYPHDDGHGNGHNPHLAHHFDTPEQQIASGKLGMWVFLATEILMFGGLFCAYSIYRHNHPDVFEYAHQWLDKKWGAINTIVLITSSLTMAWGVRLAQLGRQSALVLCLSLTIIGGYLFMGIKSVEYKTKWAHSLGVGTANMYRPTAYEAAAKESIPGSGTAAIGKPPGEEEHKTEGEKPKSEGTKPPAEAPKTEEHKPQGEHGTKPPVAAGGTPAPQKTNPEYFDPNAGGTDAAKVRPDAVAPAGLAPKVVDEMSHRQLSPEELEEEYAQLPQELDKKRTYTFFQIYFLMTGLHGLHVLIGMALIFWILVRSVAPSWRGAVKAIGVASIGVFFVYLWIILNHTPSLVIGLVFIALAIVGGPILRMLRKPKPVPTTTAGEFGPDYFAPVDIVGLYWHLVDLIWIFLFPLLYLIR